MLSKTKLEKIYTALANTDERTAYVLQSLEKEIKSLRTQIASIKIPSPYNPEPLISMVKNKIDSIKIPEAIVPDMKPFNDRVTELEGRFVDIVTSFQENIVENPPAVKAVKPEIDLLGESIKKLRMEILNKIANIGGGAMNRQMFIGGADPLGRYTDVNLKAGANMQISYVNNNTTGKVDITFTGTGLDTGIIRAINSTAVSSTFGATAGTDYVALATAGVKITLPTAVGNTNLYTVKNLSTSSVLVATTGGQTVDGDPAGVVLSTQYTAVDLISDGSNYNLT